MFLDHLSEVLGLSRRKPTIVRSALKARGKEASHAAAHQVSIASIANDLTRQHIQLLS